FQHFYYFHSTQYANFQQDEKNFSNLKSNQKIFAKIQKLTKPFNLFNITDKLSIFNIIRLT
ncbi:MAG: hypothetical protein LBK82_03540, partial [Planctomycetaceae bacterium]|nr:hypothetical protein [Planctomycetaceae bacterium]